MTYEKICEICGTHFVASKSNAKYCCKECKRTANRAANRRKWDRHKEEYKVKEKMKKRARKSNLVELQREANRLGISYGKLQAMKYLEEEKREKVNIKGIEE